jgi:hypothetical protein
VPEGLPVGVSLGVSVSVPVAVGVPSARRHARPIESRPCDILDDWSCIHGRKRGRQVHLRIALMTATNAGPQSASQGPGANMGQSRH